MSSALLIIAMQFIIVPLTTLRTTFMVKGKIPLASFISAIENLMYVISLSVVFSDLSNHLNMVAYAVGYAGGILIGGRIERKLAVGYRMLNVSLLDRDEKLIEELRTEGFGVTVFEGEGKDGDKRVRLDVLVKRSREKEVMKLLETEAPKAFVVAYEPTSLKGGYLTKSMNGIFH
jgi:uncharacterized protein YebE (UPF0316 family)